MERIYYHNSKRPIWAERISVYFMIFPVLVWDFGWVILQIIRRNPSNDTAGEKEAFWRNCRYKATAWCPFSLAKAQEIYHNYLWQRLFAQQAAKPNNFQASQKKKQKRTSGVVGTYDNCCSVNILNIYKKIYKIEKEWLFDDIVLAAQYTMTITTNIKGVKNCDLKAAVHSCNVSRMRERQRMIVWW